MFPPICAGCGRRGVWLCAACREAIHRVSPPICRRCGRALAAPRAACAVCQDWPAGVGPLRAAFVFDGPLRESIHRFKYGGERARGAYLGALLADEVSRLFEDVDAIDALVPVALHRRRERARGFNQARVLAEEVGERLGVPIDPRLRREVETRPQVGLSRAERRENVQGAFRWDGDPLDGRRLLLVDDVVTTGATIAAAAAALVDAGAARVLALALARDV